MTTIDMSTGLINSPQVDLTKKANTVNAQSFNAPVTKWDITPDQTVENRISGIIAKNSPLMQQAETSAKQYAATRGLGKSSMEAGAMQDAVIRAAMPIAQQDAQAAAQSNQFNAGSANTASLNNANQSTDISRFNAGIANQSEANYAQSQNELAKMATGYGYEKGMQSMKGDQAKALMDIESKYKTAIQTSESAANFYSAITAAMAATQSTANMDAAQKAAAATYYNNALQNGLAILSYAGGGNGTDLTSLLKFN